MTPEQFLSFSQPLAQAMLLIDKKGCILATNDATGELLKMSPLRLRGRLLGDLVSDPLPDVIKFLSSCSRCRKMVLGALTFRLDSGDDIPCRAEGAIIVDSVDSQPTLLLMQLSPQQVTIGRFSLLNERIADLSREMLLRRQSEEELRRQKEWLEVLLTSIGDAVVATDAAARVVFMNPVAQAYLGYPHEEMIGRPLHDCFHIINEDTRQPVENPVTEVIRRGATIGLANHTVLINADGKERPIEDSAAPIKDRDGNLMGVILVFHDVTPQRAAERELRAAAKRKDEFLAILAHELRNPLAPIRNSLELLKRSGMNEAASAVHGIMDRQLSQMVRLIDDLLAVRRIKRGKLAIQLASTDLAEVLRQCVETIRPQIDAAGHALTVNLPTTSIHLRADPVRLAQVFANVLNNACKFTPAPGRVTVSVDTDQSTARVRIVDSGIGIPPEKLGTVFEMFSQIDSSIERSQGGLGIGLALVKEVVHLHGGSVEAQSAGVGRGTEVIIALPVHNSHDADQSVEIAEPSAQPSRRRFLVVDDNRDAATTLGMILQLTKNDTRLAHDGIEALSAADNFRPDVILLDIGLPKMNGFDVCRKVRQFPWSKETIIIALTGWGQEEDRRKSKEAGFDGHLVKPIDHGQLLELLGSLLREPA